MIDLNNPPAPVGGALVTITAEAFRHWMGRCGFAAGAANVNQEVYFIYTSDISVVNGRKIQPNWHITAMTTYRNGGDCINFHFKVEIGKAASHYWHYVIHQDAGGNLMWVGAPNPNIPETNEGGGGAAGDIRLLRENKTLAISQARIYGLDKGCNRATQARMIAKLSQLINCRQLALIGDRIEIS